MESLWALTPPSHPIFHSFPSLSFILPISSIVAVFLFYDYLLLYIFLLQFVSVLWFYDIFHFLVNKFYTILYYVSCVVLFLSFLSKLCMCCLVHACASFWIWPFCTVNILIFAQWIYILLLLYSSIDFISIFLHSIYLEEKSIESMWCRLTINTTELLTFHTFIHRHSNCDPMHYHTLGQLSLQTSVRLSVTQNSSTSHLRISLIFCNKLAFNKSRKVTKPDFREKIYLGQKWAN